MEEALNKLLLTTGLLSLGSLALALKLQPFVDTSYEVEKILGRILYR